MKFDKYPMEDKIRNYTDVPLYSVMLRIIELRPSKNKLKITRRDEK